MKVSAMMMTSVVKRALVSFLVLSLSSSGGCGSSYHGVTIVDASVCPGSIADTVWTNVGNIMKLIPVYGGLVNVVSSSIQQFATALSGCPTVSQESITIMQNIAKATVDAADIEELQISLDKLVQLIPTQGEIQDFQYHDYISAIKTNIEAKALRVGFETIELYVAAMSIKLASHHALLSLAIKERREQSNSQFLNGGDSSNYYGIGGGTRSLRGGRILNIDPVTHAESELSIAAHESLVDLETMENDLMDHMSKFEVICTKRNTNPNDGGGGAFRKCWVNDPQGNLIVEDWKLDRGPIQPAGLTDNRAPDYAKDPNGEAQALLKKVKLQIATKILNANYYQAKLDTMRIRSQYATSNVDYNIPFKTLKVSWSGSSVFHCQNIIDPRNAFYGDFNNNGVMDVIFQPTHNFSGDNVVNPAWYIAYDGASKYNDDNVQILPQLWGIDKEEMTIGDFNGDGIPDIFHVLEIQVMDQRRVSYSGTQPWTKLRRSDVKVKDSAFGDFNGDGKTDLFTTLGDDKWQVSYGGAAAWSDLNLSGVNLNDLRFGDFDGDGRTDVFTKWDSNWRVSYGGSTGWKIVQSSGHPLDQFRFGDFNGDGKTDVFATWDGTWYVSYGGTGAWSKLNQSGHQADDLLFEDLNGDGKTDIIVKWERPDGLSCY